MNQTHIRHRIFTSASPNKEIVSQNEQIFGQLYSPVKVKELIRLKWLSSLEAYVYVENKDNVNSVNYILNDFIDKKCKYGFSFHNKQQNAFNLFHKHHELYQNGSTQIKPFLLIGDNFTEPRLQEVLLDYDCKNVKTFESSLYSIAYVVAKYSMGYDFNKLDFMCLSDPKLSVQDIIQCIGRGLRPDELGENGSNKEKVLTVSLPVYIDENGDNKYDKAIEVLNYLKNDIGIPFEEIKFIDRNSSHNSGEKRNSNEYFGINEVKSVLFDLMEAAKRKVALEITYEKAKKIVAKKQIRSKESYFELCDVDLRLSKEPDVIFKGHYCDC